MLKKSGLDLLQLRYINIFVVEQTSQKVNKTLCTRPSRETKKKNKCPTGVTKMGNRPSDRDVNWRPPVQGQSSPVQVKDPYTGSILMHVGSSCKHTGVYTVHLPRIIRN